MTDWNKRNGGFLDDFHVREFQVSNLSQQIDKLKQENEKLSKQHLATIDKLIETQQRIEKAVEYIESQNKFREGCDIYFITDWEYVLNILRGNNDI